MKKRRKKKILPQFNPITTSIQVGCVPPPVKNLQRLLKPNINEKA
jgi:hypothetical protein